MGSFDMDGVLLLSEIASNVIAFIPLGIYTCLLKEEWGLSKKLLAGVCVSTAFELIQFAFALGICDITDVLSNTLGTYVGVAVSRMSSMLLQHRATLAANAAALLLTVYTVLRFAYLFYLGNFVMRHLS
jgi:glycopeptide antibiotics resistance protein